MYWNPNFIVITILFCFFLGTQIDNGIGVIRCKIQIHSNLSRFTNLWCHFLLSQGKYTSLQIHNKNIFIPSKKILETCQWQYFYLIMWNRRKKWKERINWFHDFLVSTKKVFFVLTRKRNRYFCLFFFTLYASRRFQEN